MKLLLSCSVIAEHTLPDIVQQLEFACYITLLVACVQTKSIDVLKDIYELDLKQYLSCYWTHNSYSKHLENVATFFKWMQLKVRIVYIMVYSTLSHNAYRHNA